MSHVELAVCSDTSPLRVHDAQLCIDRSNKALKHIRKPYRTLTFSRPRAVFEPSVVVSSSRDLDDVVPLRAVH